MAHDAFPFTNLPGVPPRISGTIRGLFRGCHRFPQFDFPLPECRSGHSGLFVCVISTRRSPSACRGMRESRARSRSKAIGALAFLSGRRPVECGHSGPQIFLGADSQREGFTVTHGLGSWLEKRTGLGRTRTQSHDPWKLPPGCEAKPVSGPSWGSLVPAHKYSTGF